ncbi:MAG: recombinase family protein [Moraxellaceae bacterium]|nr:recombinase family protein [Moraxellaceae bacterium]
MRCRSVSLSCKGKINHLIRLPEKVSGVNTERPVLEQCLKSLQPGDTLVVWRIDRLGRSLKHLVEIVTYLVEWGRYFESLTDRIELSSQNGHDSLQVFKALAEFERNLLSEYVSPVN